MTPTRPWCWALVPSAVVLGATLVVHTSDAAFTGTTGAAGAWTSGTVTLTDDDGGTSPTTGTALFTATGLLRGSTGSRCIVVTSTSTLPSSVRLWTAGVTSTNGLASYLQLTVQEGSGGSFGSCTGFTAASTAFTGTLAQLAARSDFATGLGTFAPAPGQQRTYRFTYALDTAAPNTVQSSTAQATFVWEARNT